MPLEVTIVPCLKDNYGYILRDEATGVTAVVDAPEAAPLIAKLDEMGGRLDLILITHHHADHIDGVPALVDKYGARTVGNRADAARLPKLDVEVGEGDTVQVGDSVGQVYDVSGHTIGHIAYCFPESKAGFTADSLMALGCGRVFEGTFPQMWESLSKIMNWAPDTMIYSGHNYGQANARFALSIEPGNAALKGRAMQIEEKDARGEPIVPVSIAEELATNPFLRASTPELKAAIGMEDASDAEVFAEVRTRKDNF